MFLSLTPKFFEACACVYPCSITSFAASQRGVESAQDLPQSSELKPAENVKKAP